MSQFAPRTNDVTVWKGRFKVNPFASVLVGLTILAASFAVNFRQYADRPMEKGNVDEAHWIAAGYYFHLAFQQRDFTSKDWNHYACLDQPPVAKYVFGLASTMAGFPVTSLELEQKHFLLGDIANQDQLLREFNQAIPIRVFRAGRLVSTLAFALSAVMVFHLAYRLYFPWAGVAAAIFFASSPMILRLSREVMAEGLQVFLVIATVELQLAYLDARKNGRSTLPVLGGLAFALALLFNTKVNGIVALPLAMAGIALAGFSEQKSEKGDVRRESLGRRFARGSLTAMAVAGLAILLAVAVNPSLHSNPLHFVRGMFGLRVRMLEIQRQMIYSLDLPTCSLRVSAFLRATFLENDRFVPVPMLFFSFVAGLCVALPAARRNLLPWCILGLNGLGWALAGFASYSIDVSRYLVVLVPFVCVLAGGGLVAALTLFGQLTSPWWKRATIFLMIAACSFSLLVFVGSHSMERFLRENPDWRARAEIRAQQALKRDEEEAQSPDWYGMLDEFAKHSPF